MARPRGRGWRRPVLLPWRATARWVDRLLFPANWPSASERVPELQQPPQVGDQIPDGPPGTAWFVVEHVDPPHLLVLHSTTHLPATWRARLGAGIDRAWTFILDPSSDAGTRLLLRVQGNPKPWWLTAAYVAAIVPADHLLAGSMLKGIRRRAWSTTTSGQGA